MLFRCSEKLINIHNSKRNFQTIYPFIFDNELNIPVNMIDVEDHLSHYGISSKRMVDIVFYRFDKN